MRIVKAAHMGMCFGVRDAIQLATEESKKSNPTILGDLVHNETVLANLKGHGIEFAPTEEHIQSDTVIITAHGTAEKTVTRLKKEGFNVVEATCPLVKFAHTAILRLEKSGAYPVIIGQKNHVEVRGLTGDLNECSVILSMEEVDQLPEKPHYGVAAQTTQPLAKVNNLVERIRHRFPKSNVQFVDTVCQPTKQRQSAAIALAQQADVIVVIGGANSNNTRELAETCSQWCNRVHHVKDAQDLRSTWFNSQDLVGITAGTSTPEITINQVTNWLEELAGFQNRLNEHINQAQS